MSKEKGRRRERKAEEIYQEVGFETYSPQHTRWGDNDILNLFDILAVHPARSVRFAQVKSNRAAGIQQWVDEVVALMPLDRVVCEFLVCHDDEGWRLLQPAKDGYTAVVDERESDGNMGDGLIDYLEVHD